MGGAKSSQQNCPPPVDMAALVREVYPCNTMKRLARLMSVPLDTARHWLYRSFSPACVPELAAKLIPVLEEEIRRKAAVRQQLNAIVDGGDAQSGDVLAGEAVPCPRLHQYRASAG